MIKRKNKLLKSGYLSILLAGCLLVITAFSGEQKENSVTEELPNIIIFIADDAGWRDFGIYGNEVVQTPHIDELGRNGLLFQNAFLTTPQCSPSRISILTGLYPHATGAEDLHMPLPSGIKILPGFLNEIGYTTGHMQKTHYGPNAEQQFDWYSENLSVDFTDFLNSVENSPFFLWVGFHDPHRSYGDAPKVHSPEDVYVPPHLVDDPETRADLAEYYDEITRMDSEIGDFIEILDSRQLRENTLVIFLSDNGAPFPREKGTLYDSGIKTPFIVNWPAKVETGREFIGLTSVIDLTPTILSLTGIPVPDEIQGEDVSDTWLNSSAEGRDFVFSERNWHDADEHMRSLRTDRFKLIRNEAYTELPHGTPADIGGSPSFRSLIQKKKEGNLSEAQSRLFQVPRARIELYDLSNDPWELSNLAAHPDYWQIARELASVLDSWMEETGDFPPHKRVRDDHTDRMTGVWFSNEIPPMRNQ